MEAAPELPLVVRGSLQRACLASLSAGALKRCPTQREPGSVLKASSQDQERHANGYLRPPRARGGGRRRHRARCGEDAAAVVRRRPPRRWNISGRQRAVDPRARPVDLSTDLERPRGIRHPQALVHGGPPVFTGEWSGAERAAPVAARRALYCAELLCCRGKCGPDQGRGQGYRCCCGSICRSSGSTREEGAPAHRIYRRTALRFARRALRLWGTGAPAVNSLQDTY